MGLTFELDVSHKSVPIHVFDTVEAFRDLMRRTVHDTLRQGIFGWEVTDCHVIMTDCGYQAPPRKWPGTTSSDYRLLTPIVLMVALKQAGTTVHEPVLEFHMEFPGTLESAFAGYRPIDGSPPTRPRTDRTPSTERTTSGASRASPRPQNCLLAANRSFKGMNTQSGEFGVRLNCGSPA